MLNPSVEKVFKVFKQNFRDIPLTPAFSNPFQTLVAVMLSARTRDETTVKVALKLYEIAPTSEKIAALQIEDLEKILHPLGFYKTKAKHLKKLSADIGTRFNGNVPKTLDELTTLPGIGRKTANVVLARTFGIPAIGVDTHVHRIANTLGWVKTKTPEKTEIELMKIIPKKYWAEINTLFVSIGQQNRSKTQLQNFLKANNLVDR